MSLTVGDRLGHYDVTALLGEGGMGQVWQATDTQLNRQVALKILPDAFAGSAARRSGRHQDPLVPKQALPGPGVCAGAWRRAWAVAVVDRRRSPASQAAPGVAEPSVADTSPLGS